MARRLVGAAAAQIERAAPLEEEQAGAPLVGCPPPSSNGGFVRGRWWWWPAPHPVSRAGPGHTMEKCSKEGKAGHQVHLDKHLVAQAWIFPANSGFAESWT